MTDQKKTHTIDASGKSIGRVAAEAAKVLMGKTVATYTPHKVPGTAVTITNAKKLRIGEKKRLQKKYTRFSGQPGGLTTTSLSQLVSSKGYGAAIRHAVEGMLPRNTLFVGRMKNLTISE